MFVTAAYAQTGSPSPMGDIFGTLMLIVPMFVVLYLFIYRPQQQRVKKHNEMIGSIRRGDTVVTGGGLVGKVTKVIDDREIEVDLGNNVKVTALKAMVADVRVKGEPVPPAAAKK